VVEARLLAHNIAATSAMNPTVASAYAFSLTYHITERSLEWPGGITIMIMAAIKAHTAACRGRSTPKISQTTRGTHHT